MMTSSVVAGYFRVSVARDGMKAPELYVDEISRFCSYQGLTLGQIYSDIDFSAFRGAKPRPSLEQLIEHRKEYSAVVVPKLSRFGRSMKELIRLFDLFDSDGIPLVFLDMNLDTSTSQGRLLRHILAAFAEYESDVKADYTRASHRRIRAEGRPWGIPPFGYARGEKPNTWVVDSEKAAVIRAIYSRYAGGSSANSIAGELNALGIPTTRKLRWRLGAITKILDNPAYAALSLVDDELVPAQWDAIVDRQTWDAVRQRRTSDPRVLSSLGRTKPRQPYLLSGLMWCGQCERKMSHTTNRNRHAVYMCQTSDWGVSDYCRNSRVRDDLAEAYVTERFLERCSFSILTELGARAGKPRTLWEEASLPERKRLLDLVIARIVVTPLPNVSPRDRSHVGLRHDLSIEWKARVDAQDIAVVAEEPPRQRSRELKFTDGRYQMLRAMELRRLIEAQGGLMPANHSQVQDSTLDPRGKSWAEWQRALIESR